MKTSAELKCMARRLLRGNYGNAAGALLVMRLVSFVPLIPCFAAFVVMRGENRRETIGTAFLVMAAVTVIVYMIFSLVMMVGYIRLCYRIAAGEAGKIKDLFYVVGNHLLRFLGLMFFMMLYSILAAVPVLVVSILFAVGGISFPGFLIGYILVPVISVFVFCRYAMSLFVLVENPQMRAMEALRFSRDLMRGNIWRLIRLELSFFGMFLLEYITFGVGYFWIMPYLLCTNALFYLTIKDEKYPPYYPDQNS